MVRYNNTIYKELTAEMKLKNVVANFTNQM
jgi:hypothetical protein